MVGPGTLPVVAAASRNHHTSALLPLRYWVEPSSATSLILTTFGSASVSCASGTSFSALSSTGAAGPQPAASSSKGSVRMSVVQRALEDPLADRLDVLRR